MTSIKTLIAPAASNAKRCAYTIFVRDK